MPKINVYLPDDLAAEVKAAGFAVSPVCQQALREAVGKVALARRASEAIRDPDLDLRRVARLRNRLGSLTTPRLQEALRLAREGSRAPGQVDTADLLAGTVAEGSNLAVAILHALDVDLDELRDAIERLDERELVPAPPSGADEPATGTDGTDAGGTEDEPAVWDGYSLAARAALAAALDEAVELGHNYLGCEHLLLGLVGDATTGAGATLKAFGVERANARRAVKAGLAGFVQARQRVVPAAPAAPAGLEEILERLDAIERRLADSGA